MAQVIRPFGPAGLLLKVLIGLDGPTLSAAIAAGQPVPRPIWADAEIDTAATKTAVAGSILRRLGLTVPVAFGSTLTAAGYIHVPLYDISIGLPPLGGLTATTVLEDPLRVTELDPAAVDVEVLFGLDLLLDRRLFIDGPNGTFTLDV
jgi:hypothetical protein